MSKLTRVLALGALLTATTLASTTAVAYADEAAVTQDGRRPPTERQVGEPDHHRRVAPQQATADAARRAALPQEHYYSTWGYSNTPAPAPAKPKRQPDWLVPGLGVLAATGALATGLAVLAAKRARRRTRLGHAA
jgi:hypothetical protein